MIERLHEMLMWGDNPEGRKELERLRSSGDLLGFIVVEPAPDGGFNPVLGTPIFDPDDRESAEECVAGEAFVAVVRRLDPPFGTPRGAYEDA